MAVVRCRSGLADPFELSRVRRNDTFLEDEAAIEATFAGLYHAIRSLREFIEGKSLDRTHWRRAALRSVDLGLHLDLHGWNFIGLADDFHSQCGLVDKGIEWQDRKDGARRPASGYVIDTEEPLKHALTSGRVGREIHVTDDEFVAVAHGAQRIKHVRAENWIDRFQHATLLGIRQIFLRLEHDPEKRETGFPSRQTRSICAEIMLKQNDQIMIRFNLIGS